MTTEAEDDGLASLRAFVASLAHQPDTTMLFPPEGTDAPPVALGDLRYMLATIDEEERVAAIARGEVQ